MLRSLSKASLARAELKEVNFDEVITKGPQTKKKLGSDKWENRYAVLVPTHLAWFEDEEAFLKRKVKAVINLVNVDRVYSAPCPPDERPKTNAHIIGDRVMHVVLKNGQTYVFGEDSWTETVTTALKRCVANNPSPSLSPRMSDPKGLKKLSSGRLSILAASSPKVERKPTKNFTDVSFAQCIKSGYVYKRKYDDKKKWEYRYMVLTTGHLVYFEDKAARDKEKPIKGAIALDTIKEVFLAAVERDTSEGLPASVVHVVLEDVTYLMYDAALKPHMQEAWNQNIKFAIQNFKKK